MEGPFLPWCYKRLRNIFPPAMPRLADRPGVDCGGGTGISLAIRAGDGADRIPQKPFASFQVIETINASAQSTPTH